MACLHEKDAYISKLAYQVLLDSQISKLPVNVLHIAESLAVKVIDNREVNELRADECGAGIYDGSTWNIVYDSAVSVERIRFTIAHELGHIALGHIAADENHTKQIEKEADIFAASLLSPTCILWELRAYSASSIALLCKLSHSSAKIQSKAMVGLLTAEKYEYNKIEKDLIDSFEDFIIKNRLQSFRQEDVHFFKGSRQKLYQAINTKVRKRKNLSIDGES